MMRPMIFDAESVRAILDGRKTQTRRVAKPGDIPPHGVGDLLWVRETWATVRFQCDPEGWIEEERDADPSEVELHLKSERSPRRWRMAVRYRATYDDMGERSADRGFRWRSPLHMPRWTSRITLEIRDVRCERVQCINEDDAFKEGVTCPSCGYTTKDAWIQRDHRLCDGRSGTTVDAYADRWDSINGKKHPWSSNPWVWVYRFVVYSRGRKFQTLEWSDG